MVPQILAADSEVSRAPCLVSELCYVIQDLNFFAGLKGWQPSVWAI